MLIGFITFAMTVATHPVFAHEEESDGAARMTTFKDLSDNRANIIRGYLHQFNSPLEDEAQTFVREADKNNIDWKLVVAIAGTESTFGKHIPGGSYNAWGWGVFTGAQDGVHFTDWKDGIVQVSQGLRKNYIDRGATNIYDIGWIYAANGISWGDHVNFFMQQIASYTPDDPVALSVAI